MWAFTIKNKLTAAALLFTVLCLVMLTNLQEQRMVSQINKAVTSIYEDRVVVGNYILTLSNHIEDILILLNENEITSFKSIESHLNQIEYINNLYDKTILTETEQKNFEEFKTLCQNIKVNYTEAKFENALLATKKADSILETLSSIQVEEGKSKLDEVLSMTNTSNILSYIEIVILIVIAVLIQILVLSSKALISNKNKPINPNLN